MVTVLLTVGLRPISGQSAGDYIIGPQDVLAIQIFDQPDLGGRYTVEADGTFSFPLIGRLKAAGLSLRGFEAELKKKLSPDYFRNPQITVSVETYRSQRVFVMGEVRAPGAVTLTGGMTLIEALSRAGSTLPSASGDVVVVRPPQGSGRQGEAPEFLNANLRELENGELKQNIELRDGDQVYVSKAESIYIYGEVKTPGAFTVQKDTTVLQALALAGGASENAATNRIEIQRLVKGKKEKLKVKLGDPVKPGDTIIVPQRRF